MCNAAQLAAQTQITARRNLAQTQQRPTALYADVQLVVHIGTEHAQTTLHNAQPDVSTTGRGKGLVQADLGVCGAGELNKSAATAGLQSADPLSVHIQLCAHKTRAHRLPFELGQDATADHDVFVANAFASAVVCDGTQLGDHARIATAVGRCAQHHQTRHLQIAVRIEIGRAQSRGDRAIIKAQPSAQHVVAQVTGAVRACDTQVTGGQLHGQITRNLDGTQLQAALGLQINPKLTTRDLADTANVEVDVTWHTAFLHHLHLRQIGTAAQARRIQQHGGQIALLQTATKTHLSCVDGESGSSEAQIR